MAASKKRKSEGRAKNKRAVQIGLRIKQARQMAGFDSQSQLTEKLQDAGWSKSKLGLLEAGYATPDPEDVDLVADLTDTSSCWIMFGVGPIRQAKRDRQAVRHQNICAHVYALRDHPDQYQTFLSAAKTTDEKVQAILDNPDRQIGDRIARQFEKALEKPKGYLDEQNVENDPLCRQFPDDLRELMAIYSELPESERKLLLSMARTISQHQQHD